jgi:hypothetical protein
MYFSIKSLSHHLGALENSPSVFESLFGFSLSMFPSSGMFVHVVANHCKQDPPLFEWLLWFVAVSSSSGWWL